MTQTAVHVRCNAGKVKRVQREGRETLVLPSYAAKADTVLNNVLYTKAELESSFAGLNRTPAPLGHPMLNGNYVPAMDPEALARNHVFAWNENPRWEGDRIALDVVIDEARAQESEGGRQVLEAINAENPISTSTGLLCNLESAENKPYEGIARNIEWDHVAILLDEAPAISPEQGVGIFVNAAQPKMGKIKVINSVLEDAERDLEWAADMAVRAVDKMGRAPLVDRIVSAIKSAVGADEVQEPANNRKDADMADQKQLDELSTRVNALEEKISETITNAVGEALKPVIDAQAEMAANAKAKEEAEHKDLVNKVVEAKIDGLGEDVAKKMDATALNALLTMHNARDKKAAPMVPGFMSNAETTDDMSPLSWGAKQ